MEDLLELTKQAGEAFCNDQDPTPFLRERALLELRRIKEQSSDAFPIRYVRIKACTANINGFCPWCQAHNNLLFSLDSELESPHLPVEGCECYDNQPYCVCYYEPVFDDEL